MRRPPKLRHGVTALQALDVRVTHFFRSRIVTTYLHGMLALTCDALLYANCLGTAERTCIPELHACVTGCVVMHVFSCPVCVTRSDELEQPAAQ